MREDRRGRPSERRGNESTLVVTTIVAGGVALAIGGTVALGGFLVSTTSPDGTFLEQDETNNAAWVKFTLSADSNGNRKVTVTDHSPCESPGMCGDVSPNR